MVNGDYKPRGYWDNPENILNEFYRFKKIKKRTPTCDEFGSAVNAIVKGRYYPEVKSYSGFLKNIGERRYNFFEDRYLGAEKVDRIFNKMERKLGRIPLLEEFMKEDHAYKTIKYGHYSEDVHNYNQFLKKIGKRNEMEPNYWKGNPERVLETYLNFKKEKGISSKNLFKKLYPGAFNAIVAGWYSPRIHSWNEFKKSLGENVYPSPQEGKWTTKKIGEAYRSMKEGLGRKPKSREFERKYGGALTAIRRRKFHPRINTWGKFLTYIGERATDDWNDLTLEMAYRSLRKEGLPSQRKFSEYYGSDAIKAIKKGKFDTKVRSYKGMVKKLENEI